VIETTALGRDESRRELEDDSDTDSEERP